MVPLPAGGSLEISQSFKKLDLRLTLLQILTKYFLPIGEGIYTQIGLMTHILEGACIMIKCNMI
jgi:hypothetical protein